MSIKIDDAFRKHLLPLDVHEIQFLEESIKAEGCREALTVWQEQGVLIDGHHRYDICTRNGLPYETRSISLADREAVLDWMDKNQAGRRNMTTKDLEIVRGRIYNRRKKKQGGTGANQHEQSGQSGHSATADAVAAELDTSSRTVRRSGQRAAVYDAMLELGDDEAASVARSITRDVIADVHAKPAKQAAEELKEKAKAKAVEKAEPREGVRKKVPPSKLVEDKPAKAKDHMKTETFAMNTADVAITQLKGIPVGNDHRDAAFDRVTKWIASQRKSK